VESDVFLESSRRSDHAAGVYLCIIRVPSRVHDWTNAGMSCTSALLVCLTLLIGLLRRSQKDHAQFSVGTPWGPFDCSKFLS
jgi:hypothetical protein